jgi:hypothetical protein
MDGYGIARIIAFVGALIILAPALYVFLRDREAATKNPVFWMAISGVGVLLWTAVWQP